MYLKHVFKILKCFHVPQREGDSNGLLITVVVDYEILKIDIEIWNVILLLPINNLKDGGLKMAV